MGRALASNKTLTFLDVSMNDFGDVAATAIMLGMLKNNTLSTLKLNLNGISDTSVDAFCSFLKVNQSLRELYLDGNDFESSRAALLEAASDSGFAMSLSGLDDDSDGPDLGPMLPVGPMPAPAIGPAIGPAIRPAMELGVAPEIGGDTHGQLGDNPSIQESGA